MKSKRANLFLTVMAVTAATMLSTAARAQLQFIPEPWIRAWMNDLAPGCVNAEGYLDPAYPALDTVHSAWLLVNVLDLTGIQYLHHLKELHLTCNGAGTGAPILPDSLERLYIEGFAFTEPLQLNAPLRYFSTEGMGWGGTLLSPLPETLDTLILRDASGLGLVLPPLPIGLLDLELQAWSGVLGLDTIPASLRTLRLGSGIPICLPELPSMMDVLGITEGSIRCLPNLPSFTSETGMQVDGSPTFCDAQVDYYCGPGLLEGTMWNDRNGNNLQDEDEGVMPGDAVSVEGLGITSVHPDGRWTMRADTGHYVVHPQPMSQYVTSLGPGQYTPIISNDALIASGSDFAYTLQAGIVDLELDFVVAPLNQNHQRYVTITVKNVGVEAAEGTLVVHIDPALVLGLCVPEAAVVQGNTVTWDLAPLDLLQSRQYRAWFWIPMSAELGSIVTFTAESQTTIPDLFPENNLVTEPGTILGPYDPNDKVVRPSSLSVAQGLAGADLTYTIRFQNTGTAPAERVVITDTLSTLLDPMSMHFTSSSHPCTWSVRHGVLVFAFDNIMLPDSGTDQLASQGFVRFSVRSAPGLTEGVVVSNTANIYFDLNPAVITTPAECTVEAVASGLGESMATRVWLAPNPTTGLVRLALSGSWGPEVLMTATDASGRRVRQILRGSGPYDLDLGSSAAGLLHIELFDGHLRQVSKVMKY